MRLKLKKHSLIKFIGIGISIGLFSSVIACSNNNSEELEIAPNNPSTEENEDSKTDSPIIPSAPTSKPVEKDRENDKVNPIIPPKNESPIPKDINKPVTSEPISKPVDGKPVDKANEINLEEFPWYNNKQTVFVEANSDQKRLSEEQIYQSIFDRTFAIGFNTNLPEETNKENIVTNYSEGTGWLLDYAWEEKDKSLVFFIATNAHVYDGAFNAIDNKYKDKYPEYFADIGNLASFNFGKAIDDNSKVQPSRNNEDISKTNKITSLTNDDKGVSSHWYNQHHQSDLFDNPQTVFIASNFLDEKANNALNDDNASGIIKDFAVFSLRIHYDKFISSKSTVVQSIKKAIDKAIVALDDSLKIDDAPNRHNQNINYVDIDQPSLYKYLDVANAVKFNDSNFKEYKNSYSQLDKLYIGGYPKMDFYQVYLTNNPSDLISSGQAFDRRSFSNGIDVKIFERNYKGVGQIALINNSSLYYGASGSLVLNEFGLINGIYSVTKDVDNKYDRSQKGGFTFLVQNFDLYNDFVKDEDRILYAHNLIDGSDKTRYPKQITSYRENLKMMLSDYKFTKTALFKNGV